MKKLISLLYVFSAFALNGFSQDIDPDCPKTITVQHVAGDISPVTVLIEYKLAEVDGVCWVVQFLGARRQPTSWGDKSDEARGWYWQYDNLQGYQWTSSGLTPNTYKHIPYKAEIPWTIAKDPCAQLLGLGWHIPDYYELNAAFVKGSTIDLYNSVFKYNNTGYLYYTTGELRSDNKAFIPGSESHINGYRYLDLYAWVNFGNYPGSKVTEYRSGSPVRCCKKI
jgi:hypothetical protein